MNGHIDHCSGHSYISKEEIAVSAPVLSEKELKSEALR